MVNNTNTNQGPVYIVIANPAMLAQLAKQAGGLEALMQQQRTGLLPHQSAPGPLTVPTVNALYDQIVPPIRIRQDEDDARLRESVIKVYNERCSAYSFLADQFSELKNTLKRIEKEGFGWVVSSKEVMYPCYVDVGNGRFYYSVTFSYVGVKREAISYDIMERAQCSKKRLSIDFGSFGSTTPKQKYLIRRGNVDSFEELRQKELERILHGEEEALKMVPLCPLGFHLVNHDLGLEWEKEKDYAWLQAKAEQGISLSHIALLMFRMLNEGNTDADIDLDSCSVPQLTTTAIDTLPSERKRKN